MPKKNKQIITDVNKIYFVIFMLFTIFVILVFLFIYIKPYWDFHSALKLTENYYKSKVEQTLLTTPQIRQYDPISGQVDADVTIYEFSDIHCSNCQALQKDLSDILKFYGNKVRIVYKALPITVNPETRPGLISIYCASEQFAFEAYKEMIYENSLYLNKQKYLEFANQLNLDTERFTQCLDTGMYDQVLERNLAEAASLQITSIPTVYVNDEKVEGLLSFDLIKSIIDKKL